MSEQFAVMVATAMRDKRWKTYQLSAAIGLLPSGRAINPTQVQRILDNRRANLTREIVDRLIEVLDLDEFAAYEAADLRPPGFTADDHRSFALAGQAGATGHAASLSTNSNPTPLHNVQWLRPPPGEPAEVAA